MEAAAYFPLVRPAPPRYITPMNGLFPVFLGLALFAVLAVLLAGVFSMAKGGEFNRKYGNKLMRWRVGLQGLALLLFALAWYVTE